MRLLSWNVNGLRAILNKGFENFIQAQNPDMLCLQEIRAYPEQVEWQMEPYREYWHPAQRKGYSGVLTLSKAIPLGVWTGMNRPEHHGEGRLLTLEYSDFFLVNVYSPNVRRDLSRLNDRVRWDRDLLRYLKVLEADKPVIFCGDLNVAHREIDLANPAANRGNAGFTAEERAGFECFIAAGFVDTFREFVPEGGHYTWWSFRRGVRARNIGWRIDYFLISPSLRPRLKHAFILPGVMGSDHCPVGIVLR